MPIPAAKAGQGTAAVLSTWPQHDHYSFQALPKVLLLEGVTEFPVLSPDTPRNPSSLSGHSKNSKFSLRTEFSVFPLTLQEFPVLLLDTPRIPNALTADYSPAHGQAATKVRNDVKKLCEVGFLRQYKIREIVGGSAKHVEENERERERDRWQTIQTLKLPELPHMQHSPNCNKININYPEFLPSFWRI